MSTKNEVTARLRSSSILWKAFAQFKRFDLQPQFLHLNNVTKGQTLCHILEQAAG